MADVYEGSEVELEEEVRKLPYPYRKREEDGVKESPFLLFPAGARRIVIEMEDSMMSPDKQIRRIQMLLDNPKYTLEEGAETTLKNRREELRKELENV